MNQQQQKYYVKQTAVGVGWDESSPYQILKVSHLLVVHVSTNYESTSTETLRKNKQQSGWGGVNIHPIKYKSLIPTGGNNKS